MPQKLNANFKRLEHKKESVEEEEKALTVIEKQIEAIWN